MPNAALEGGAGAGGGCIESLFVNTGQGVRAGQARVSLHSAEVLSLQRDLVGARVAVESAQLAALRAHARVLLDAHQLRAPPYHEEEHDRDDGLSRN